MQFEPRCSVVRGRFNSARGVALGFGVLRCALFHCTRFPVRDKTVLETSLNDSSRDAANKRTQRERPPNKNWFILGAAYLLISVIPPDRTLPGLSGGSADQPAGVIEALRICLLATFPFISSESSSSHPNVSSSRHDRFFSASAFGLRRRLFMIFHLHLTMLHPGMLP